MARHHIVAALASATFSLLVILQLLITFGFPQLDFLSIRYDATARESFSNQIPINSGLPDTEALEDDGLYLLGVGKADITGPVVEINMMGYADPNQVGSGLRQRLYSRAFIIGHVENPDDRFVYLVLDTQSGDTAIRYGVLQGLQELGQEYAVYGQRNVALTGTHSHSGPGAWLNYLLPQITSKGFNKQSYQAIVDGTLLSIRRAHESMEPGYLSVGSIDINDANINRSPYAYLANPAEERARYESDVDKALTMLKFSRAEDGKNTGVLTWFPVHGTSMLGNNTLISGDNKGVAAYLFEESVRDAENAVDGFVAGFSQANVGDTSPNVLGAYCEDGSDEQCNFEDSTCSGRNEPCHGRGPFFRVKDEGAASCYEIGLRQFLGAKALYESMEGVGTPVRGSTVKSMHAFKDFSNYSFPHPDGSIVSTCPAALGYSFAAGTTDGPGAFDFKQNSTGSPDANPVWSVVSRFLHEPSEEQKVCHYPKPILLDVGEIDQPYLWTPNVVDIQLLRVGQLVIIVSPGEATTMAATPTTSPQKRNTASSATKAPPPSTAPTRSTPTSTSPAPTSPTSAPPRPATPPRPLPPIYINSSLNFITGVAFDRAPFFTSFGDVLVDTAVAYPPGAVASAVFVGANPRNDLRLEGTYAAVEKYVRPGVWVPHKDDRDWELVFRWTRTSSVLATSEVEVRWEIAGGTEEAIYRLRYFGESKAPVTGEVVGFEGASRVFRVG
ncbi:MAG: Neutral alkaline nonlysosomal ceramidase [Lasallia pustulata]|uniref:Neutral ceramidase n=1 Tax=Lasallia pustulata TaxID=136370 RepID=A0A5M8PPG2_9LECA|nr:MAG: Neutral alkaline nonlysosomal ceramidase [Lasallia pustulata]